MGQIWPLSPQTALPAQFSPSRNRHCSDAEHLTDSGILGAPGCHGGPRGPRVGAGQSREPPRVTGAPGTAVGSREPFRKWGSAAEKPGAPPGAGGRRRGSAPGVPAPAEGPGVALQGPGSPPVVVPPAPTPTHLCIGCESTGFCRSEKKETNKRNPRYRTLRAPRSCRFHFATGRGLRLRKRGGQPQLARWSAGQLFTCFYIVIFIIIQYDFRAVPSQSDFQPGAEPSRAHQVALVLFRKTSQ